MFPHFLKARSPNDVLEDVNKHEEMLIDLRDAMDMSDLKNNVSRNSLTSDFTVIRSRPEIFAQETQTEFN